MSSFLVGSAPEAAHGRRSARITGLAADELAGQGSNLQHPESKSDVLTS